MSQPHVKPQYRLPPGFAVSDELFVQLADDDVLQLV
ncbi:MAG: hypothetical protein FD127_4440 [Acidimicrobiaceae bacterium]|nr:MAG: hypothetical protein FD127_4440 [Acidimicrobiaceae bacterium]